MDYHLIMDNYKYSSIFCESKNKIKHLSRTRRVCFSLLFLSNTKNYYQVNSNKIALSKLLNTFYHIYISCYYIYE